MPVYLEHKNTFSKKQKTLFRKKINLKIFNLIINFFFTYLIHNKEDNT